MQKPPLIELHNVGKFVCENIDSARRNQFLRMLSVSAKFREKPREGERFLFEKVDLCVHPGDRIYIACPPKSGKSTFAKTMAGLLEASCGKVKSRGKVLYFQNKLNLNRPLMSLQSFAYSVASLLEVPSHKIQDVVKEALQFVGVSEFRARRLYNVDVKLALRVQGIIQLMSDADVFIFEDTLPLACEKYLDHAFFKSKAIVFVGAGQGVLPKYEFNKFYFLSATGLSPVGDFETARKMARGARLFDLWQSEGSISSLTEIPVNEAVLGPLEVMVPANERKGNGAVRFMSIRAVDRQGRECLVRSGEYVRFVMEYVQKDPAASLDVGHAVLLFENKAGSRLLGANMEMRRVSFFDLPMHGQFEVEFEKFPLYPGRYNLVASLAINGQLSDKIDSGWQVDVAFGDFFGVGKLPSWRWGMVFLQNRWNWRELDESEKDASLQERFRFPSMGVLRKGSGEIHFFHLQFKDRQGNIVSKIKTGEYLKIELFYRSRLRDSPVLDGVGGLVFEEKPGHLVLGSTMIEPEQTFKKLPSDGVLVLEYESLPLLPGEYHLVPTMMVNGALADRAAGLWKLNVEFGDYYGTGILPVPQWGSILCEYNWSFSKLDDVELDDDEGEYADAFVLAE